MKSLFLSVVLVVACAWPAAAQQPFGVNPATLAPPVVFNPTSTATAVAMPNNIYMTARNAAGTGTVDLWKVNASNQIESGANPVVVGALITNGITASGSIVAGATSAVYWTNGSLQRSPADGVWTITNNAETFGIEARFAAAPVIGACGTSPSIAADATNTVGTITVGTVTPASCAITFNGTWTKAPKCTANTATATAGSVRALGTTTTTTTLTITPATAFADSTPVVYQCWSVK